MVSGSVEELAGGGEPARFYASGTGGTTPGVWSSTRGGA